jgi:hypothetical protein
MEDTHVSHVATVEMEVNDLSILKTVCDELGLQFMEGQTTYKWYGKWVNDYHGNDAAYRHGVDPKNYGKCEHAIRVPGATYEIGVVRNQKGKLCLVWDAWGGGGGHLIEKVCGKGCAKLLESYSKQLVTKQLKAKGYYKSTETKNSQGETELIFQSY